MALKEKLGTARENVLSITKYEITNDSCGISKVLECIKRRGNCRIKGSMKTRHGHTLKWTLSIRGKSLSDNATKVRSNGSGYPPRQQSELQPARVR